MISTLRFNILTKGDFIIPRGDIIEYTPSTMSKNVLNNTIYFAEDVKITMPLLKEAKVGLDYKAIFTTPILFKRLINYIAATKGTLSLDNADTFLEYDKYSKEIQDKLKKQTIRRNKILISDPTKQNKVWKTEIIRSMPLEEIYSLKKKHIINSNIKFIIDIFFPKKEKINIHEEHVAIINETRYRDFTYQIKTNASKPKPEDPNKPITLLKNIVNSDYEYVVNIELSLLNNKPFMDAKDGSFINGPSNYDFNRLSCIEKSTMIEDQMKDLFDVSVDFFSKPNQVVLDYKQSDEYKEKMYKEKIEKEKIEKEKEKIKKKEEREKKEKERERYENKETQKYLKLKREVEMQQLKPKLRQIGGKQTKKRATKKRKYTKRKYTKRKYTKRKYTKRK